MSSVLILQGVALPYISCKACIDSNKAISLKTVSKQYSFKFFQVGAKQWPGCVRIFDESL